MHPVQPPEPRHRVEHHMLEVDRQIEQQYRDHDGQPDRHVDVVEQTPATILSHDSQPDGEDRKGQSQDHRIDHHQREVIRPADDPRYLSPTPWCRHLPHRHRHQNAQKEGQTDGRFSGKDGLGQGASPAR